MVGPLTEPRWPKIMLCLSGCKALASTHCSKLPPTHVLDQKEKTKGISSSSPWNVSESLLPASSSTPLFCDSTVCPLPDPFLTSPAFQAWVAIFLLEISYWPGLATSSWSHNVFKPTTHPQLGVRPWIYNSLLTSFSPPVSYFSGLICISQRLLVLKHCSLWTLF